MATNSTEHKNILDCDENNNNDSQLIRRKENEGELNSKPVDLKLINKKNVNVMKFL